MSSRNALSSSVGAVVGKVSCRAAGVACRRREELKPVMSAPRRSLTALRLVTECESEAFESVASVADLSGIRKWRAERSLSASVLIFRSLLRGLQGPAGEYLLSGCRL